MIGQLFITFLEIGILGFGGGYAILSLIQGFCVNQMGWLAPGEYLDLVTISQLTPGPILLNAATYVGSKMAEIIGALTATLASILPSVLIVITLTLLYNRYKGLKFVRNLLVFLRPIVIGLIGSACMTVLLLALLSGKSLTIVNVEWGSAVIIGVCLTILLRYKINPIFLILGSGLFSLLLALVTGNLG